jgi:hypothetical protein
MDLETREEDAREREDQSESWVELFPFVLMVVVIVATILAVALSGER